MRMPPFSNSVRIASSVLGKPPLPLPSITPIRVASSLSIRSPAPSIAWRAAATANWEKRAMRRASLRSM